MKIQIDNASQDKKIFEGWYSYLEGLTAGETPSFFIYVKGTDSSYEIKFSCDNKEELESLITDLQDLRSS